MNYRGSKIIDNYAHATNRNCIENYTYINALITDSPIWPTRTIGLPIIPLHHLYTWPYKSTSSHYRQRFSLVTTSCKQAFHEVTTGYPLKSVCVKIHAVAFPEKGTPIISTH